VLLFKNESYDGVQNLLFTGLSGFIGLLSLFLSKIICDFFGVWGKLINAAFLWYIFSDLAMIFMFYYIIDTKKFRN
jgi:hypothetical protein